MELSLHANATTTPKVRTYIQRSRKPVADLAIELGVSETTIRRWRERTSVIDRSHAPKTLTTSLSALEEALVCELRTKLQLPLDDITEVMRRCVNAKLSRSAIHRCLKRQVSADDRNRGFFCPKRSLLPFSIGSHLAGLPLFRHGGHIAAP